MDSYSLEDIYVILQRIAKGLFLFAIIDAAVYFAGKDMRSFDSVAGLITGLFSGGLGLIIRLLCYLGPNHPHDGTKKYLLIGGAAWSASSVSFTIFRAIRTFLLGTSDNSGVNTSLLALTIGTILFSLILSGPVVIIFAKLYTRSANAPVEKQTGLANQQV